MPPAKNLNKKSYSYRYGKNCSSRAGKRRQWLADSDRLTHDVLWLGYPSTPGGPIPLVPIKTARPTPNLVYHYQTGPRYGQQLAQARKDKTP